jgi:hypothetical protein
LDQAASPPSDLLAVVGDLTRAELHRARAERRAGATPVGDAPPNSGAGPRLASDMVAVRLGLHTRWPLGSVVAGGSERRTHPLASGDPLDREPDVDGQADAVADRPKYRDWTRRAGSIVTASTLP